jgi:hypothetical protein
VTVGRAAAAALALLGFLALGFMLGGLVGGRLLGSGMGVDRLADAIGGAAIGLLCGLGGAILSIRRLAPRSTALAGAAALALAAITFAILRALATG